MIIFSITCACADIYDGGIYIVGEDIPEGAYSFHFIDNGTMIDVFGAAIDDYETNGGHIFSCYIDADNPAIDKIGLEEGNAVSFSNSLEINKYEPMDYSGCESFILSGGIYIVGEDIPQGAYSLHYQNSRVFIDVFGAAMNDYITNGGLVCYYSVDAENPTVDKLTLEEGNTVSLSGALEVAVYKPENYADQDRLVLNGGIYTVGEDIPEGAYSVHCVSGSTYFSAFGAAVEDYDTNGGLLYGSIMNQNNPTIGKIVLEEGNVISFDSTLELSKYEPINYSGNDSYILSGGIYKVGEDLPAGTYSVHVEKGETGFSVYGDEITSRYDKLGGRLFYADLDSDNSTIGKIVLEEGYIIIFKQSLEMKRYEPMDYSGVNEFFINSGTYIIGEDIPSGSYSIQIEKGYAYFQVLKSDKTNYNFDRKELFAVSLDSENSTIGKLVLQEGNVILFGHSLVMSQYQPVNYSNQDEITLNGGTYTIGEDLPAGSYTVHINKGVTDFYIFINEKNYYDEIGEKEYYFLDNRNRTIEEVVLEEGNMIAFDAQVSFVKNQKRNIESHH